MSRHRNVRKLNIDEGFYTLFIATRDFRARRLRWRWGLFWKILWGRTYVAINRYRIFSSLNPTSTFNWISLFPAHISHTFISRSEFKYKNLAEFLYHRPKFPTNQFGQGTRLTEFIPEETAGSFETHSDEAQEIFNLDEGTGGGQK